MSPRLHFHERAPKPQLLDLGLPLSLPSPVANLLNPLVHVGPSSSSGSSSQQPPKPNPAPSPAPKPSPTPSPVSSPSSAAPPSSSSTGGNSHNGGSGNSNSGSNGGNGNSGNNGGNQSSGNGNQGSQNGGNNGQGNIGSGNSEGGQPSSADGNSPSTPQSGSSASTGSSSSSEAGQSQPSTNAPPSDGSSSTSSGEESSSSDNASDSTSSSNDAIDSGGNGAVVNSESAPKSAAPVLGDISGPTPTGDPALQSGKANAGSNPSNNDQPQALTNNDGASSLWSKPSGNIPATDIPSSTNLPANGAAGSKSHVGGIAAGVTVSLAALTLIAFILFFLRRRHKKRQDDRRITWIGGFVEGNVPDMAERSSIRSSWGTPAERMTWARISNEDPFASRTTLPVLPLPVHSQPDLAIPEIPENPFSDISTFVEGSLHPHLVPSTLPIRLSLISAGSGQDPFDDVNRTTERTNNTDGGQMTYEQNASTTGHGPSQANFPMPPSTPGSVKSGIAIGDPSDLSPGEFLATPSISLSFPDSPISPTFASPDTASYHRRVSVKYNFYASQARSDEVHLEKGEEVDVVSIYEDGWAFVQKKKDNERGLVPLNCLDLTV